MPWIDSVRPHVPLVHNELNKKESVQTAWMSKGDDRDTLRGYALYRSETPQCNIDSMQAFQFIPYDPVAGFHIKDAGGTKKYYYFATAISRTNMESPPIAIKDLSGTEAQSAAKALMPPSQPNAGRPNPPDTTRSN